MKIAVAQSAGFCLGVKRALEITFRTVESGGNIEMLGDIVHNEDVVKQINQAGIKKVKALRRGKNKIVLIRAHGVGLNIIKEASRLGYKIIDATCPMVKEIHQIASNMEGKGYQIIIIGDKLHSEVIGITGQLKTKVIVIDSLRKIPYTQIRRIKKAAIVVQSTQDMENVLKIAEILKSLIKDVKFFNTICMPTRLKQKEIRKMPQENDVMIIIGSKTSANTKRLYEISKSLNPRTYWIRSRREIKPAWLRRAAKVGITAGSSTPDTTTQEVIKYLEKIK